MKRKCKSHDTQSSFDAAGKIGVILFILVSTVQSSKKVWKESKITRQQLSTIKLA